MEKLFIFNKWFVLFCALFIVIFAALRFVIDTRLKAFAKANAERVFTWDWTDRNLRSTAEISQVKVLKMNANDATVEVSGEQTVSAIDANGLSKTELVQMKPEKSACKAALTLYRIQNQWALGRVELQ